MLFENISSSSTRPVANIKLLFFITKELIQNHLLIIEFSLLILTARHQYGKNEGDGPNPFILRLYKDYIL